MYSITRSMNYDQWLKHITKHKKAILSMTPHVYYDYKHRQRLAIHCGHIKCIDCPCSAIFVQSDNGELVCERGVINALSILYPSIMFELSLAQ